MKNLTYTSELVAFDEGKKSIDINVFLEKEIGLIKYTFKPISNISKKTGGNQINAILCHLISETDEILCGDEKFPFTIDIGSLNSYSEPYDFNTKECLIIIMHDEINVLPNSDTKFFFDNLELLYNTSLIGNYALHKNDMSATQKPRMVGISIVK